MRLFVVMFGLLAAMVFAQPVAQTEPDIRQRPIRFSAERQRLTLEYIRRHYDPNATGIEFVPVMIVVHWTDSATLEAAWNIFNPERLTNRPELIGAGALNVSAHYLIDRDGTIYQLMPETRMARHTIGLNRKAIGLENVGGPAQPLTPAQREANARLIAFLAGKHRIRYVIGHLEYGRFRRSGLWEERETGYFTIKSDPGAGFMKDLRLRLRQMGLVFASAP